MGSARAREDAATCEIGQYCSRTCGGGIHRLGMAGNPRVADILNGPRTARGRARLTSAGASPRPLVRRLEPPPHAEAFEPPPIRRRGSSAPAEAGASPTQMRLDGEAVPLRRPSHPFHTPSRTPPHTPAARLLPAVGAHLCSSPRSRRQEGPGAALLLGGLEVDRPPPPTARRRRGRRGRCGRRCGRRAVSRRAAGRA